MLQLKTDPVGTKSFLFPQGLEKNCLFGLQNSLNGKAMSHKPSRVGIVYSDANDSGSMW